MEQPNWAALAIPVFLAATIFEAVLAHRRGRRLYAFGTAISDLGCGSVFQAGELVLKLLTFAAYVWLFDHRIVDWGERSAIPWVIGILGVDFLFYWWHRSSHVVNVLWAVHGVHHQSEDYNLAVALRQPLFEPITWFAFYAVLALLGVSPVVYLVSYALNRVYQFWVHTELVNKLPAPFEWLLNTPSNHRVHHGVQPQYLDKNYGAILMIWDRMFGTFEPEGERVRYGTTIPLRSYNPLWANFEHLHRTWKLSRTTTSRAESLFAWVAHPAWVPRGGRPPEKPAPSSDAKYQPQVPTALQVYVVAHMGLAGVALAFVVFHEHAFTLAELAFASVALIAAFVTPSALIEQRAWAVSVERVRLLVTLVGTAWLFYSVAGLSVASVTGAVLGLCPLWIVSFRFLQKQRAGLPKA